MGHISRYPIIAISVILLLAGCGKSDVETEDIVTESKMETNTENSDTPFFPLSYVGGTDKIKFDCDLEIPEEFDPFDFYIPKINGLQCVDQEAAFKVGVGEQEIEDQLMYPKTKDYIVDQYHYFLDGGIVISIDTGFSKGNDAAACYIRTAPSNEREASQEKFSFGTAEDYIDQIKNDLTVMSYPVGEFYFSWFSVNKDEYRELEQNYLENGLIEPGKVKGEWTDEDNAYYIYAWQRYGGLPVFREYMTYHMKTVFESYQRAPLSAICSEKGILTLEASAPYLFEATEEKASFLPFSEIVSTVEKKYDNLLDESVYTVYRAKLAIRVYHDEKQQYAAEPVWYFEMMDDNGNSAVILVNALSGKEIYLDS